MASTVVTLGYGAFGSVAQVTLLGFGSHVLGLDVPGVEYTLDDQRPRYHVEDQRTHYASSGTD